MTLTTKQIEALKRGDVVHLTLPELGDEVVVIRSDVYQKSVTRLPDETVATLVEETMDSYDQNDPLLRAYQ